MDAQPAKSARWLRRVAAITLVLMPLAALGSRFQLWHFGIGLALVALCVLLGVLIQVVVAIWLLRRPEPANRSVLRTSCLLALPQLLFFTAVISNPGARVPIHNISTDPIDPPAFVAGVAERGEQSNPLAYTAEVAAIQNQHYPDISPHHSSLNRQAAFDLARQVSTELGWDIYAADSEAGRIEAAERTLWFGFVDDIVIRVRDDGNGSVIDLRSVSRVGQGDLGANAERIRRFLERFRALENDA